MPRDHGSFPDRARVALLLIDVINALDFPGSSTLLEQAMPMAKRLAVLKRRAKAAGVPSIYVNDNFGRWKSDFQHIVRHCTSKSARGAPVSRLLRPQSNDYFVLKPMHSGFYSTTLEVLLEYLRVDTLILTGIATNICVLFTASDAHMRDYSLYVPRDCVAANTAKENTSALDEMKQLLKADIRPSDEIDFKKLANAASGNRLNRVEHKPADQRL
jgi:nicotinamidase-related amidase